MVVPGLGQALLLLSQLGERKLTMVGLGEEIDLVLQDLMHLPNLFIARVESSPPRIRFLYCRDPHDRHVDRPMNGLGLTDRVFLSRKSLLLGREEANTLLAAGEIVNFAVPSQVWLGVPLCSGGEVIGVMATQDYERTDSLGRWHEAVFNAVAPTVAGLLERHLRRSHEVGESEREEARRQQTRALFATIGHDVRSPLSVIQGYADLLKQSLRDTNSAMSAERILKAAQELSAATDRMIDYTSAEADATETRPASNQLSGWMRSLESWVESAGESMGVGVQCELVAPEKECAEFDGERLRQLLQHLVRVALSRAGIKRLQMRLKVQPVLTVHKARLRLAFSVEARPAPGTPGRPSAAQDRLRPVSLDDTRTYDAATVSLAIAQRLAEMQGADLRVNASLAAPWRATLILTAPAAGHGLSESQPEQKGPLSLRPDQLERLASRLVVIDRDPGSRERLVEVVAAATHVTPPACSQIQELSRTVEAEPPAIIVASIAHGPTEVREIALVLRACDRCEILPCLIAVSGDQTVQGVESLLDAGADAYVPRPLNQAAMLVALSEGWLEYERRVELAEG